MTIQVQHLCKELQMFHHAFDQAIGTVHACEDVVTGDEI